MKHDVFRMTDSEEETVERQLKVIFLGDTAVGKTSIIRRFCYDTFSRQYNQTIGAEFYAKRLDNIQGEKDIKLEITDIGKNEMGGRMLEHYLHNTNIIFLVYDITNHESFNNIVLWLETVRRVMVGNADIAVIGNKSDLEHQRAVRMDKTKEFVNKYRVDNYLISARTGENVNLCFTERISKHFGISLHNKRGNERQNKRIKTKMKPPLQKKSLTLPSAPQSNSAMLLKNKMLEKATEKTVEFAKKNWLRHAKDHIEGVENKVPQIQNNVEEEVLRQ